jgi:hypothetical protein
MGTVFPRRRTHSSAEFYQGPIPWATGEATPNEEEVGHKPELQSVGVDWIVHL